jgi:aminoglycoside phosphotransferase (APT) family kinase protein
VEIEGLRLLTGGASRQTWSFDAVIRDAAGERTLPLVMRSDPRRGPNFMPRETEYRLLEAAGAEGVPVPKVHLMGDDSLDAPFFLMERVEGETIARRLLRDEEYAEARAVMTGQLAGILARIHAIPFDDYGLGVLPSPETGQSPAEAEVTRFEQTYRAITPEPHPAFELAFRWLRAHLPQAERRTLVHGDYRIGNVIFGPEGVHAVLDWELAHIGDPIEDIGWICVRSWRFGNDELPVGGIGTREEFFQAYEAAGGGTVRPEDVRFWEVFGNLRWGIICITQARTYLEGLSHSVELASIGRRTAETEWELLNLMEES